MHTPHTQAQDVYAESFVLVTLRSAQYSKMTQNRKWIRQIDQLFTGMIWHKRLWMLWVCRCVRTPRLKINWRVFSVLCYKKSGINAWHRFDAAMPNNSSNSNNATNKSWERETSANRAKMMFSYSTANIVTSIFLSKLVFAIHRCRFPLLPPRHIGAPQKKQLANNGNFCFRIFNLYMCNMYVWVCEWIFDARI